MVTKQLEAGKQLGQYKIIGLLGKGGMAAVYKALDVSLNREVAVKVLSEQLSEDADYIKRFQREAQAAARLNHPHIVHIYTIGETEGHYYFAMEYIKGKSLADVKRESYRLAAEKAIPIIMQVADALGEAHKAGLVHRDIKPSNIMIDDAGRSKVTDFGIAYISNSQTKLTRDGSIIGTPEYLSPEQCQGKAIDQRSDVYSLGVTMYELLTGIIPYEADTTVAMLMKIVKGEFRPIREIAPHVPAELCTIVETMMHTDLSQRYASMEHVLNAYRHYRGEPVASPPATEAITVPSVPPNEPVSGTRMEAGVTAARTVVQSPEAGTRVESNGPIQATQRELGAVPPPAAAAAAPAPKKSKSGLIAALIVIAIIGGAIAAKLLVFDKNGSLPSPALGSDSMSSGTQASQNQSALPNQEIPNPGSNKLVIDSPPSDASSSPSSGSTSNPLPASENPTSSLSGKSAKLKSAKTPIDAPSTINTVPSTVNTAPAKVDANSCTVSAYGASDKVDIVMPYVDEILTRKNFNVVQGSAARTQIVVNVSDMGTSTLSYYGSTSTQYAIQISIKAVDTLSKRTVGGPITRVVKYTELNAEDNLKEALRAMISSIKQSLDK
ncbi:MAG: serine/threonine protein kinase [Candidatus Omnitrophota bacterium]